MRRGHRFQCDANEQLCRVSTEQFREQLHRNQYFLEMAEILSKEEVEVLLDNMTVELVAPKEYLNMKSNKLYFSSSQSALLSPRVGSESCDVNPSAIEDFMKKYEDVKNDDEAMYEKRISVLYGSYYLIKKAERPYVYGLHSFFNRNIQKSTEIIITKSKSMVFSLDRERVRRDLYKKLLTQYKQRVEFLRSFPLLSAIPQLYFHAFMPSMMYKKYLHGHFIPKEDPNDRIYFLRTGEIQFSKLEKQDEVKVYKITGQQMFVVIDDIDLIKVTSESVHIYSIKKKDLDFLMVKSDCERGEYEEVLSSIRKYNMKLKERACQFYRSNLSSNQAKRAVEMVTPITKKTLYNIGVSIKQFNQYVERRAEKKSIVLQKLMAKSRNTSSYFSPKVNSRSFNQTKFPARYLNENKMNELNLLRQNSKENTIVSMYKSLVEAGLEEKLRINKSKPCSRISRRSRKVLYSPLSTMTDLSQIRIESVISCHSKYSTSE